MQHCHRLTTTLAISASLFVVPFTLADSPKPPGAGQAMREAIGKNEIAGAVTVVVARSKTLHVEATGLADVASKKPMTADTLFWIASMTKPITGTAILMLQDEGKLNVA